MKLVVIVFALTALIVTARKQSYVDDKKVEEASFMPKMPENDEHEVESRYKKKVRRQYESLQVGNYYQMQNGNGYANGGSGYSNGNGYANGNGNRYQI